MNRDTILIDLDDTMFQSWRREDLIAESWDAFHGDLGNDDPVEDIVKLVNALQLADWDVIGLTARPEKFRQSSIDKLVKHDCGIADLLMRPNGDFRPSAVVKLDMAIAHFGSAEEVANRVIFIIDDREDVLKAFAGIGVTTLHVYARRS